MEIKKWFFHLISFSLLMQAATTFGQEVPDLKDAQEAGYVSSKQDYKVYYPQASSQTEVKTVTHKKVQKPVRYLPPGVTVYTGSLRHNIDRIARQYGWHEVVWDLPHDYQWVGTTYVTGSDVTVIMRKVLKDYPLQAIFYQGNKVLLIQPRTLR